MYNTNLGTMVGYYNQGAQEIEQQAGLQTLYLMNPGGYHGGYSGYDDTPPTPNILMSSAPATTNNIHQLLGIPLLPVASTSDPNNHNYISSLQPAFNSNTNHRVWSSAAIPQHQQQGLSLSLSPHHRLPISPASHETGVSCNGVSDMQRFWMGSKYLKVAQQLLDEVVSTWNYEANGSETNKCQLKAAEFVKINNEKASEKLITTAERQDLHMKNANLVNMLEEVEQRYKVYHHHIQTVVISFEAAMGSGAARTYTALALQTISKQFRCLKDAISAQIRGNAKSLGEEGGLGGEEKSSSGSRLRLIDQQLRHKRAFQQIGMVQHNAWRPQRGLPERSVSILRAWLFEHFLHPYPKDSDKQLLAKQAGLTRSQVSNWFINARVRLWKPMVEEMYMEELKGEDGTGDENSSKLSNTNNGAESTSKSITEQDNIVSPTNKIVQSNDHQQIWPGYTPPHSSLFPTNDQEAECKRQSNIPKRVRSSEESSSLQHSILNMDFGVMGGDDEDDRGHHGYSLMSRKICNSNIDDAAAAGFSANYQRLITTDEFNPRMILNKSSTVALTLGLPHGDSNNSNVHRQSLLSSEGIQVVGRRVELSNNEYLGGGLNKDPSSYSSSYYI